MSEEKKKNGLEEECNMPQSKLIQDVVPGQNSMFSALDRLVKQRQVLHRLKHSTEHDIDGSFLQTVWTAMKSLVNVLRPF